MPRIPIKLPRLTQEEEADLVFCATAIGFDRARTARMLGIGQHTLEDRYREILDTGMDRANCAVGGTLYSISTDRNHPNCASAGMFWMKTRMKWRDVNLPNDDKPAQVFRIIGGLPDPKELTGTIVEHVMKDEKEDELP